ncbi:MAG: sigma-70 family RNA polymerase sigma factor [Acidobacteriota bacterium]
MTGLAGGEELPVDVVSKIGRGDRSAEDAFAQHFSRRVYALAWARLRNEELARELAQDILIAVIVALRAGRVREAEKLTGFVLATARNRIANHFREESRKPAMEEATEAIAAPRLEDRLEAGQRREQLRKALQRLEPLDRAILRLNLVEQVRPEEIGSRTGLSAESVRQRKSRAIRKLGEWMERFQSQKTGRVY